MMIQELKFGLFIIAITIIYMIISSPDKDMTQSIRFGFFAGFFVWCTLKVFGAQTFEDWRSLIAAIIGFCLYCIIPEGIFQEIILVIVLFVSNAISSSNES